MTHHTGGAHGPSVKVVPLGGLGEIGMNCMAIESDDSLVVVDCGLTFPDRDNGVDVIAPDFSYLLDRREKIRAIVLTHGHEDHIGALPFLLRDVRAPVYGSPYTLALVQERLKEHGLTNIVPLEDMRPKDRFDIADFQVEAVHVTHSIVDSLALAFRTRAGLIVHSGDFNIDATPYVGAGWDDSHFADLGNEGVSLLLSDSTNSDVACRTHSEFDVVEALIHKIEQCKNRVVVGMFASNIARVRGLIEAASRTHRKLCFLGRSVQRHVACASELGYVALSPGLVVDPEKAEQVPREKLLVIATGSQGESMATLARLATNTHPRLRLDKGDDVIFSSRVIPGHERTVQDMVSRFVRLGAEVTLREDIPKIHVSGHASKAEQRHLIKLVRPRSFIPVHGTYHHMHRHARLAIEEGIPSAEVFENGDVAVVGRDGLIGRDPRVQVGRVFYDGSGPIPVDVLVERTKLHRSGIATLVFQLDKKGLPKNAPDLVTYGIWDETDSELLIRDARRFVYNAVMDDIDHADDKQQSFALRESAERALRRFFKNQTKTRPVALAVTISSDN